MLYLSRYPERYPTLLCLTILAFTAIACNKATVNFGEEALQDDPNIIYLDTTTVTMSTFQIDSLYTAGDTVFIAGAHSDSLLGTYTSKAYMQLGVPTGNTLSGCNNCSFDSIVFTTRFTGASYGDTTVPFTLQVHRMKERMVADETSIGYNTSFFGYDAEALGQTTISQPRPGRQQEVTVRMPDALGQELFGLLNRNSDTTNNSSTFSKYFNGLVLTGAGEGPGTVYYFTHSQSGNSTVVQLYYRENGVTPAQHTVDFPIAPATNQFNAFTYDRSGTPLSALQPKKRIIIPAGQTANRVYLHANGGLYPHFRLRGLLALKELHPYVKVLKAELEIVPPLLNYAPQGYYSLPGMLCLYTFIDDSKTGESTVSDASGAAVQTGNLVTDFLYHKDTRYTYDLTAYVNKVLTSGTTAERSFLLMPLTRAYENRLILDAPATGSSVKLKLYVLGL